MIMIYEKCNDQYQKDFCVRRGFSHASGERCYEVAYLKSTPEFGYPTLYYVKQSLNLVLLYSCTVLSCFIHANPIPFIFIVRHLFGVLVGGFA